MFSLIGHECRRILQNLARNRQYPVAVGVIAPLPWCLSGAVFTAPSLVFPVKSIPGRVYENRRLRGFSSDAHMQPYHFERRALRGNDVAIEILFSGICHSDLHTVNGDWGDQHYPLVPGHEIIGRVIEVGPQVTRYQVGDNVGVGCMVDSCQACDQCDHGEEQYCRHGMTPTYGSPDRIDGEITQGGYAKHIVVREEFVLRVPDAWTCPVRRRFCAPGLPPFPAAYLEGGQGEPSG